MRERLLQPYAAQILEADPRPLVLFVTTAAPPVKVAPRITFFAAPGSGLRPSGPAMVSARRKAEISRRCHLGGGTIGPAKRAGPGQLAARI